VEKPKVPTAVVAQATGQPLRLVWQNELGGLTFAVGYGSSRRFVKWLPRFTPLDLSREAVRLNWAAQYTAVPLPIDQGVDEDGSWLVTTALPGDNAVSDRWRANPAAAVTAIGRGLRNLHDVLPVSTCPFSASVEDLLADARRRAARGGIDRAAWHPEHRHLGLDQALELLADPPPIDRLVVCHGDACAPNTLIGEDGECSGHVDMGQLGVADRWADIAIATWSTTWNYGPGWQDLLLDAYGVAPDLERTAYYRLVWDLGP
jgi:aminoglycoside phosphotransferase